MAVRIFEVPPSNVGIRPRVPAPMYCPPEAVAIAHPPTVTERGATSFGNTFQGYPVILTAQVTLQPQESIDIPPNSLRNQTAFPIYIHSLRWIANDTSVDTTETTSPTGVQQNILAGSLAQLMMQYEDIPITAQYTPLYALGRSEGQISEQEAVGTTYGNGNFVARGSYASGEWRFSHPLRLDPGAAISARLLHTQQINDTVNVTLVLAGRGGVPRNDKGARRVPYIATWIPPGMNPAAATATSPVVAISTNRDLVNHSGRKLFVQRFEGRLLRLQLGNATPLSVDWVWPPPPYRTLLGGTTGNFGVGQDGALSIIMHDSKGNGSILPGSNGLGAPFRMIFDPVTRSWECPHIMDEEDYYIAQLTLSNSFSSAAVLGTTIQPVVSLIGYQEAS